MTQIKYIQLAVNRHVAGMMHSRRASKVMIWNSRTPPNQRSCFLFRIKGCEKLSVPTLGRSL